MVTIHTTEEELGPTVDPYKWYKVMKQRAHITLGIDINKKDIDIYFYHRFLLWSSFSFRFSFNDFCFS